MMETAVALPRADAKDAVAASDLVKALNHAVRRLVLRFLLSKGPASSTEIRGGIPISIGNSFNHHLDLLVNTGALTREKRVGYRESFYSLSDAAGAAWFRTVLRLTELED